MNEKKLASAVLKIAKELMAYHKGVKHRLLKKLNALHEFDFDVHGELIKAKTKDGKKSVMINMLPKWVEIKICDILEDGTFCDSAKRFDNDAVEDMVVFISKKV